MFEVNDYVVYGASGVCRIEDIRTLDFDGVDRRREYYVLQPIYTKGNRVYTPVDSQKNNMRPIITQREVLELMQQIPEIEPFKITDMKKRDEAYREALRTLDYYQWVKVIKTLYLRNKQRLHDGKKVLSSDQKYLTAAEDNLYGELAIPLKMSKEQVESYITECVIGQGKAVNA